MKRSPSKTILLVAGSTAAFIATCVLLAGILIFPVVNAASEVYRQSSEDGLQTVVIHQLGDPDWPFGSAHYKVSGLSEIYVDVYDDGGRGSFDVQWSDTSVIITFSGSEQKDAIYELPFQQK